MSEVIKEISALELAEKVESGAELQKLERMAAGAIIRDYVRQKEARVAGGKKTRAGGRPKAANPSPSAIYQRERRERQKSGK